MSMLRTRLRDRWDRVGPRQSDARLAAESRAYWTTVEDETWRSNSHFRDAAAFADDPSLWRRLGEDHRRMVDDLAAGAGWSVPNPRVVEWGCGGGANAVAFAPHASEMVLVDLSERTLEEARQQVAAACDTPVRTVRVDVDDPLSAVPRVGTCDLFLCFYVFELVPSPEHGRRILQAAAAALEPGGLAVVQFKYDDGRRGSGSRRRHYTRALAAMTTYAIPDFWAMAEECGLRPRLLTLVPRNELDRKYAYLAMTRSEEPQAGPKVPRPRDR